VSQEIIAGARQVFLAADDSKFGRHAMMRMGHLSEIDCLFTNQQPDTSYIQQIKMAEVNLIVA
jgi:DeoR family glycerol-3-phosphate regulon repressor